MSTIAIVVTGLIVAGCLGWLLRAAMKRMDRKINTIFTEEEQTQTADDTPVQTLPVTREDEANARNLLWNTYGVYDEGELVDIFAASELPGNMMPGDFLDAQAFWAEVEATAGVPSDAKFKAALDALPPNEVPVQLWKMRHEGTLPRWAAPLINDQTLSEFYQELNRRAPATR